MFPGLRFYISRLPSPTVTLLAGLIFSLSMFAKTGERTAWNTMAIRKPTSVLLRNSLRTLFACRCRMCRDQCILLFNNTPPNSDRFTDTVSDICRHNSESAILSAAGRETQSVSREPVETRRGSNSPSAVCCLRQYGDQRRFNTVIPDE